MRTLQQEALSARGASVNEYNGKMSLNINQSTLLSSSRKALRLLLLPTTPSTLMPFQRKATSVLSGGFSQVGLTKSTERTVRLIDVVRGRLADDTGTIGFLSWEPFEHEVGTLLKIDGAQVRSFRDTPELNFGRTTRIEVFHDTNFADLETLAQSTKTNIANLETALVMWTLLSKSRTS